MTLQHPTTSGEDDDVRAQLQADRLAALARLRKAQKRGTGGQCSSRQSRRECPVTHTVRSAAGV